MPQGETENKSQDYHTFQLYSSSTCCINFFFLESPCSFPVKNKTETKIAAVHRTQKVYSYSLYFCNSFAVVVPGKTVMGFLWLPISI